LEALQLVVRQRRRTVLTLVQADPHGPRARIILQERSPSVFVLGWRQRVRRRRRREIPRCEKPDKAPRTGRKRKVCAKN
jgi:transposase